MDNVVQNISINDIIPTNFEPTTEEKLKIEELAILIKQFGLLDPILVRPKDNKYEIIMGIDKYQAALLANQTRLPVIIKDLDDETFKKYSNVDTNKMIDLPSSPKETYIKSKRDSDIVNLSELSKINLEYEREDTNMNNMQFTNDMTNNFNAPNMNNQNMGPAFGGRFFPSLEDEPTNMNMMGGLSQPAAQPTNNGLIDLTDLSSTSDAVKPVPMDYNTPNIPVTNIETQTLGISQNNNFNPLNSTGMPNLGTDNTLANPSIINLESLQNNNPAVQPINDPVSMDILNADFGAPQQMVGPTIPSFDIGMQNNNQAQDFNMPQAPIQPEFAVPTPAQFERPAFNMEQNNVPPFVQEQPSAIEQPNFGINPEQMYNQPTMPSFDMNNAININDGLSNMNVSSINAKDVTPVTNTIKNLVTSLEAFGFKINVIEEDLATMSKLTIEVEK